MKIIYLEPTPNPNAFKFNMKETLREGMPASYQNKEDAEGDPLGELLFQVEGMTSVFYLGNFVTVTKDNVVNWEEIQKRYMMGLDKGIWSSCSDK